MSSLLGLTIARSSTYTQMMIFSVLFIKIQLLASKVLKPSFVISTSIRV